MKRILFAGYAPVHFICFLPVYNILSDDERVEIWLSGGFLHKDPEGDRYELEGFYDDFSVDRTRIIPAERLPEEEFDVVVCAHLSTGLFPGSWKKSVEIFHGVSYKNLAVREKALQYDYLCIPGRYHANRFRDSGLIREGGSACYLTGFPKVDGLAAGSFDPVAVRRDLGLDPGLKTILYAPTGGKKNSLETIGEDLIRALGEEGTWNLMIKPHDHPKNRIDWFSRLAPLVGDRVKLVRDRDVVPYLAAADLLISDASSVSSEYSLLDRPIIFVDVPQLIKKTRAKSEAMDMETYGRKIGVIIQKPEELVDAVRGAFEVPDREKSDLRKAMAAEMFYRPGDAAERVASVVRFAAGLDERLHPDIEVLEP